ncbi:MAG: hypothetical protein N3H30_01790 [Candidatus Micrarchaeota archaeon]|nr:hypothetical protein [Candidatus Micrarchaeota archaeon]
MPKQERSKKTTQGAKGNEDGREWRGLALNAAIIAAVLVILAVALGMLTLGGGDIELSAQSISNADGYAKLANAETIAIVMDVRGVSTGTARQVYQCGVGYATSLGLLGKNISNFAIEKDVCIKGDLSNTTLCECNSLIKGADYIILVKGTNGTPAAQFYEDHFLVEVGEKSDASLCKISAKQN